MIVNPNVVLGAGSVDELLAAAGRHPEAGAFGPLITTQDGVVDPSARHLPFIGAGMGHALFDWCWPTNPWTRHYRQDAGEPVERTPDALAGAHQRSAYRYLSHRYSARWQAPLRLVVRVGTCRTGFLFKRSSKVAGRAALPERRLG